jgi:Thioredoxin-like
MFCPIFLWKNLKGLNTIIKILFPFVVFFLFISCDQSAKNDCGSAWIGGEIVNPKKDYVIITKSRKIIDTVPLDEKNQFIYHIEQMEPGIYYFIHHEYQAFFMESGDSIMLRVNTVEFDESLSFTGKGAHKNNFMMDLFLLNENEDELMPKMNLLSPAEFENKMDSLLKSRRRMYDEFISNKGSSTRFKEVANALIDYYIYSKKELYISANARKKVYHESVEIPESFYNFRKKIDLGSEELRNTYPYYRYLGFYLDNLAFELYKDEEDYDRNSFLHNFYKSQLIDSLITNDSLKNRLLRSSAYRYFLNAKSEANEHKMLSQFLRLSTNTSDQKEVTKLAYLTIDITPGHTIPNVKLLTTENRVKDLQSTINKPTLIYFWSSQSVSHHKKIHTRANELKAKYPEYDFIGINIDLHFKKWLKIVQNSGYNPSTEYQVENFEVAELKLVIDSVNKAIIVDDQGTILNGNANIFNYSIEAELLGFLN